MGKTEGPGREEVKSAGVDKYIQLKNYIDLDAEQKAWFEKVAAMKDDGGYLPFLTTEYYLQTALSSDEDGRLAVLRQIIPDVREFERRDYELSDPLGEEKYSPFPRFVHRYPDRALMLVTDRCATYCRHCFRRSFSGGMKGPLSDAETRPMIDYLTVHGEIKEVLLTGGDPLTLSDARLAALIGNIKTARPDLVVRICSRMPVVNPERVTEKLASALSEYEGSWFITHFNHYSELTPASKDAAKRLISKGIPMLNQTVLLRGVNDDIDSLKQLFQCLLRCGIKPYYLFQGDLAAGTSHLRVPLKRALELTARLKDEISGMAMPRFALDLPGGGGKITLPSQSHPVMDAGDFYIIKGLDNEEYRYPAD